MKNSTYYPKLFFSFCAIFFYSCTEDPIEEPVETEEVITNEITDPFYAGLNENSSLEDYWELFVKDAIRSGKPDPGAGRVVRLARVSVFIPSMSRLMIESVESLYNGIIFPIRLNNFKAHGSVIAYIIRPSSMICCNSRGKIRLRSKKHLKKIVNSIYWGIKKKTYGKIHLARN